MSEMLPAIKPDVDCARTITAADVRKWFEGGHKPWPDISRCAEVAARLSKMRRRSDPPLPDLGDDMRLHWTPNASDILTRTLTVERGTITIGTPGAATFSGNGSTSVTLTGTAEAITDALRSATYAGDKKDFLTLKDVTTGATGKWTVGPSPFDRWDLWDAKEGAAAARTLVR